MSEQVCVVVLVGEVGVAEQELFHAAQVGVAATLNLFGYVDGVSRSDSLAESEQVALGSGDAALVNLGVDDCAPAVEKVGGGITVGIAYSRKESVVEVGAERLHHRGDYCLCRRSLSLAVAEESSRLTDEHLYLLVGLEVDAHVAEEGFDFAEINLGLVVALSVRAIRGKLGVAFHSGKRNLVASAGHAGHVLQRLHAGVEGHQQELFAPLFSGFLIVSIGEYELMCFSHRRECLGELGE